jgi:hypothetical protein
MSVDSISTTGQGTLGCSSGQPLPGVAVPGVAVPGVAVPGVAVPTYGIRCRDDVIEVAARRDT